MRPNAIKYKANFYPGQYYHVYNHGIAWENLFKDWDNYDYFLKRFNDHLSPYVELLGYCLLPNHFHLLIRIKDFGLDPIDTHTKILQAFANFQNGYSKAINKRHARKGRLVRGTIKRIAIDGDENLSVVASYIYCNPVQHGMCRTPEDWQFNWVSPELVAA